MTTKHTPGPWTARPIPDGPDGRYSHWIDGGSQRSPLADVREYYDGESGANASLIAAAPELLAALMESADVMDRLSKLLEKEWHPALDVTRKQARAAIAKVKSC